MKKIASASAIKAEKKKTRKAQDSIGERLGRVCVLSVFRSNRKTMASCRCDCGVECVLVLDRLRRGKTTSCGCFQMKARTTHGSSRSREYFAWGSMIQRCTNPNNPKFKDYGGRGISVCDSWRTSFAAFLSDMGPCPKGHSIDRFPNNNGSYEPGNCRWATYREQNQNYRRNVLSPELAATIRELHGRGMKPMHIASRLGIKATNVRDVIHKGAWSVS